MIKRMLLQVIKCDGCNAKFERRFTFGQDYTERLAIREAEKKGWHSVPPYHYCHKCYEKQNN